MFLYVCVVVVGVVVVAVVVGGGGGLFLFGSCFVLVVCVVLSLLACVMYCVLFVCCLFGVV